MTSHYTCNIKHKFNGLVQDCGNSSALALELPQSFAKPSKIHHHNIQITNQTNQIKIIDSEQR